MEIRNGTQQPIRPIPRITFSRASTHYPFLDHTDGLWRVSRVKRGMQPSMRRRDVVSFQQSVDFKISLVTIRVLRRIGDPSTNVLDENVHVD